VGTNKLALLVAAALLAGPLVASADTITYDFTGVVTGAGFLPTPYDSPVAAGTTVAGTYTFNYALGTTSGVIGSASSWSVESSGGPVDGNTPLGVYPFTSTVTLSTGYTYSTNISGTLTNQSGVNGYVNSSGGGTFSAGESDLLSYNANGGLGTTIGSGFQISTPASASAGLPWSSNGLPVFTNATGTGELYYTVENPAESPGFSENELVYEITSITPQGASPVPLPAAAWLMLSGLGGLGALARKKRAPSNFIRNHN
jgi:hypothetical protein